MHPRCWSAPLILGSLVSAQAQFQELPRLHLPAEGVTSISVVTGDLDNDGDLDVITQVVDPNVRNENRVHFNTDGGVFGAGRVLTATASGPPALADVDGDGDLDVLLGGVVASLWRNQGQGGFPATPELLPAGGYVPEFGDLDGDGDQDLLLVTFNSRVTLLRNDGTGTFTDVTTTHMPFRPIWEATSDIALADVDGDADLDMVLSSYDYTIQGQWYPATGRLYTNDGSGRFRDVTSSQLPYPTTHYGTEWAVGDLDLDGDVDLLVGSGGPVGIAFVNDGTGIFADGTASVFPQGFPPAAQLQLVDLDNDTDLDLVVGGSVLSVLTNDGTGRYLPAAGRLPENLEGTLDLHAADIDADSDLDLLVAWSGQNRLLFNDGRGNFVDGTSHPLPRPGSCRDIALGDADRDQDLDLVVGASQSCGWTQPGFALYTNSGGNLHGPTAGAFPSVPGDAAHLTLVDLDGDGDLDLACTLYESIRGSSLLQLFINDGRGVFRDATAQLPVTIATVLLVGDVDGDGDADLVAGVSSGQTRLLTNDGRGQFTDATAQLPAHQDATSALAWIDAERDGDLDLVLGFMDWAFSQNRVKLWRNDGAGRFTDATARMPLDNDITAVIAAGDLDGDGDDDLVLAGVSWAGQTRLFLNDGTGAFTSGAAGRLPTLASDCRDLVLHDLDGDFDLDLLLGVYRSGDAYWLNNGAGFFSDASARLGALAGPSNTYAVGDTDGDGDLDLLADRAVQGDVVLHTNRERQVLAPLLARLGRPWQLDVHSQPGYATTAHVALPLIGFAPAAIPLPPFGILGVGPATAVVLPPLLIPQATGIGTLTLTVPLDPSAAGVTFYSQALVLTAPEILHARLTHALAETIRAL